MALRLGAWVPALVLLALIPHTTPAYDRAEKDRLDAACEAARERKLAPQRADYVEECVTKGERDRAGCERYYSDYGNRAGGRAPLYYDLPECVKAFEYGRGTERN